MSERTAYLSRLFGLSVIVVAICWLLNPATVGAAIEAAVRDQGLMWCFGVLAVFAGLAVVLGHNVWTGWPAIGVTVIGWLILLKGIGLIVLPNAAMVGLYNGFDVAHLPYLWCAVMMVVGGALVYAGFRAPKAG